MAIVGHIVGEERANVKMEGKYPSSSRSYTSDMQPRTWHNIPLRSAMLEFSRVNLLHRIRNRLHLTSCGSRFCAQALSIQRFPALKIAKTSPTSLFSKIGTKKGGRGGWTPQAPA